MAMTMAMTDAMQTARMTCRTAAPGVLAPAAGTGAGDPLAKHETQAVTRESQEP